MRFLVTSASPVKLDAIKISVDVIEDFVHGENVVVALNPPQPINEGGIKACQARIDELKRSSPLLVDEFDCIVSIENAVHISAVSASDEKPLVEDKCHVILESTSRDRIVHALVTSKGIALEHKWLEKALERTPLDYPLKEEGLPVTLGELIHEEHPDIPANNWMKDARFGGHDRQAMIAATFLECLHKYRALLP